MLIAALYPGHGARVDLDTVSAIAILVALLTRLSQLVFITDQEAVGVASGRSAQNEGAQLGVGAPASSHFCLTDYYDYKR